MNTYWRDPNFPADSDSLGLFGYEQEEMKFYKWMRPSEIVELYNDLNKETLKPEFIAKDVARYDIKQKHLNDHWFLAAVSFLANEPNFSEKTKSKWRFEQVVPTHQSFEDDKYTGSFYFRFWQNGEWTEVTVDDYLPVDQNGKLLFSHTTKPNEFWIALLEKAYAKLHGSYKSLEWGTVGEAFTDLTGGICEMVEKNIESNETELDEFVKSLKESIKMLEKYTVDRCKKCLVSAVILKTDPEPKVKGFTPGNIYSISKLKTVEINEKPVDLLLLRNIIERDCFTEEKWNGDWSDSNKTWDEVDKSTKIRLLNNKPAEEFWISLSDFTKYFCRFETCFDPEWFTKVKIDHKFDWKKHYIPKKYPEFQLIAEGNDTMKAVYLEITQIGRRKNSKIPNKDLKNPENRFLKIGFEVKSKKKDDGQRPLHIFQPFRNVVKSLKVLSPGDYIITPKIYEEGEFRIRLCQVKTTWQLCRIK